MFQFLELSLNGWDLWPPIRIPMDRDVIVVTGPNGSGKTTLLDAIRQLLSAPRLSSRRRLQHYIRNPASPALVRAVVSNRAVDGGEMPFARERITTPIATLACALVPAPTGTPEKRYAILPGRPALEVVRRHLLETREFYPPERYQRALEYGGVSRSLMSILAIEQGKTNSLFELKPRELFKRVLEMLGDHAVLERYRDALREYEETEREVDRQSRALQRLADDLRRAEADVRELDDYEAASAKVSELESRLPASELQDQLVKRMDLGTKIAELTTKTSKGAIDLEVLRAERLAKDRALEVEDAALVVAKQSEDAATAAWVAAREVLAAANSKAAELDDVEQRLTVLPPGSPADAVSDRTAADAAFVDASLACASVGDGVTALARDLAVLEAGRPVLPNAVAGTMTALSREGLEVALLADTVAVRDQARAQAIEAALGDARFALSVASADLERVAAIAREHAFPGPILGGRGLNVAVAAGPLELLPGTPAWVAEWLDSVELATDGSWQDFRGRWLAPVERVIGRDAVELSTQRVRRELESARCEFEAHRVGVDRARTRRSVAEKLVERLRERERLEARARELAEVRALGLAAEDDAEQRKRARLAAVEEREAAHDRLTAATTYRDRAKQRLEEESRILEGERRALATAKSDLAIVESEISRLEGLVVDPDLRAKAVRRELDGLDTVRADLQRAEARLADLPDPPGPEVREEARRLKLNLAEADRHLASRRQEADRARLELDECRRRYLEVIDVSLREYKRRAVKLGADAQVEVRLTLPRLENDERVLAEAGIEVEFGFDGKDPLPMGDPSFSGGQQVIAGLVLLMAMSEGGGRGFFMLDEPFAHLSLDRVDDVGRFLRATRSQFIITAPTTLDRAQLDPASLVIVLRKKKPGELQAPVPMVAGG